MRTKNKESKTYLPAVVGGALVLAVGATLPLGCSLSPTVTPGSAGDSSIGNSSNTGGSGTTTTGGSGTTTTGGSGTTTTGGS
ncbi:MAG TPA: hypothetical protein VK745_18720, partial [Polyangiaceae bacterium]|nr:hypothetical protein [Polyangiaceae bacterium]